MPTFVAKGPIVPEELVQELEDDRVVLFCGAGISMDAGLPSYVGLVEAVYEQLHVHLPSKRDRVWEWPDRMLGDLEIRSQPGQVRTAVRMLIDKAPTSLTYHKALLRLARLNRCSGLRLVTTNFDTYFEQALEHSDTGLRPGIDLHSAPVLPIPRDARIMAAIFIARRVLELPIATTGSRLLRPAGTSGSCLSLCRILSSCVGVGTAESDHPTSVALGYRRAGFRLPARSAWCYWHRRGSGDS